MERYIVREEGEMCSIIDSTTGLQLEWARGRFNDTQRVTYDAFFSLAQTDVSVFACVMAKNLRELGDSLQTNHRTLL